MNSSHDHKPVQHQDGKPPLCNTCRLPQFAPGESHIGDALALFPNEAHAADLDRFEEKWGPFMQRDGVPNLIYGGRHTGKTRAAMQWLLSAPDSEPRVLIVGTVARAKGYKHQHGMPLNDSRIISWRQMQRNGPTPGVAYAIDDAGNFLEQLLGTRLALMTVLTERPATP